MTREFVNEYMEIFEALLVAAREGSSLAIEAVSERAKELRLSVGEFERIQRDVNEVLAQEQKKET